MLKQLYKLRQSEENNWALSSQEKKSLLMKDTRSNIGAQKKHCPNTAVNPVSKTKLDGQSPNSNLASWAKTRASNITEISGEEQLCQKWTPIGQSLN